jgi:hypothetical protein
MRSILCFTCSSKNLRIWSPPWDGSPPPGRSVPLDLDADQRSEIRSTADATA